jgi:hypothetical protein
LANAPKDRSSDHLVGAAFGHPAFEEARLRIASASLGERLDFIDDFDVPLPTRAIAVWRGSAIRWPGERRASGDLSLLMAKFVRLGVPADLLWAVNLAAMRTREPIVVMLPLLWLSAYNGASPSIVACPVPDAPALDGVALYAFDKHTAIGKAAIHRFARESEAVRDVLAFFVEGHRAKDVAAMAAFHVEAAAVSRRLAWEGSAALEALGVEADMLRAGAPLPGVAPILAAVHENLGHLNAIRVRLFSAQMARRFL